MPADGSQGPSPVSPEHAQGLLDSIPRRPRRVFTARDHLSTAATVLLSFAAGLLTMVGHVWWAIPLALGAIVIAHGWIKSRLDRPNEPRLKGASVATAFTVWLLIPIWRVLVHGETVPLPEGFLFAALAPAAWLVLYLVLLIRR
ncbi:hypothetical protein GCM10010922_05610 [Microbacterium sorbitolivorans]|uniref:Uncharacterized protein n=1 Tax=Microbacterium sorbitolivorans TaxID=1867410 RepID=A0A367Y6R6_9MICO|nr:hypothetical protein [Microbacterium sorbitolivorans]RCK61300.1 hypothetical protein DTO57_01205 [Microbacterium sorbitolivorans]GGF33337.1 hypothetical protein GCM10010922_05610 [Microbacterium sorbitolivorans]